MKQSFARPRWLVAVLGALLAWALASMIWAIDPMQALERTTKVLGLSFAGLVIVARMESLDGRGRGRICDALAAGAVLGVLILIADSALDGAPRRLLIDDPAYTGHAGLNRAATIAAIIAGPATLWLWRRWGRAGLVLLAATVIVMLQVESASAYSSFAVGVAVFAAAWVWRRGFARLVAVVLAVGVVLAPAVPFTVLDPARTAGPGLPTPAVHRLHIWRFTAERIRERPLLGWGMDAARNMPGRGIPITELDPALAPEVYGQMVALPLHPHNGPLQVWLELGVVGALLVALLVAGLARAAPVSWPRAEVAMAVATVVVAFSVTSFSYGVWQPWWIAALWLAGAFSYGVLRESAAISVS